MSEGGNQRVRACLACGELLSFDERTCPSCGHHEPLAAPVAAGELAPCPACGEQVGAELVFCPACGHERGSLRIQVTAGAGEAAAGGARGLSLMLLALTVAGPLALLAALLAVLL